MLVCLFPISLLKKTVINDESFLRIKTRFSLPTLKKKMHVGQEFVVSVIQFLSKMTLITCACLVVCFLRGERVSLVCTGFTIKSLP